MTSGTFTSVPIDSIWLVRAERQRVDLKDIPDLADSIRRTGLIHPPVIRKDGKLIVGERRWEACKALGWTAIPIQYIEDLDEHELQQVELEENLRRAELPWKDECLSVEHYHQLRLSADPTWNNEKTAEALGVIPDVISRKRGVALELLAGNKRVEDAPMLSTAVGIVRRDKERKAASVLQSLSGSPQPDVPLLNEDFHEWAKTYDGEPFNLIHCDFPYGVNADKHDQGAAKSHGGYEDTAEIYWKLFHTLNACMVRGIVAESAHLMFWFSMDYYWDTAAQLTEMGWKVDPFPLIWFKSDNTGILPDPNRGPRRLYETCFFASRGDRKIVSPVGNCVAASTTKELHMSEKTPAMLRHFMRMLVDEYTSILDPTCGSANALRVARELGAGRILGLERDAEFYGRAREAWIVAAADGSKAG